MTKVRMCKFIARLQPVTIAHRYVIREALKHADYVNVDIGSSNEPRRPDYIPFNAAEREHMLLRSLDPTERERVICTPIEDYLYNMNQWIVGVQNSALDAAEGFGIDDPAISLIGHSKDRSSFYLKKFPQWDSIEVPNYRGISATPFRDAFFLADENDIEMLLKDAEEELLPKNVCRFLWDFSKTDDYLELSEEFKFIRSYKKSWENTPYPPKFITVDACPVQAGNVLLVKRKARPGKGLWALPGGHLEDDEFIADGIIRELQEETGIKVPEKILRGSMSEPRVFDHPKRSSRGRTVTHAALIHLQPEPPKDETNPAKIKEALALPKVKGMDDAEKAKWFPLAEVRRDMMFEDHWHIIDALTANIKKSN